MKALTDRMDAPETLRRRAVARATMRNELALATGRARLLRNLVQLHETTRCGRNLSIVAAELHGLADALDLELARLASGPRHLRTVDAA